MIKIEKLLPFLCVGCLMTATFGAKLSESVPKGWGEDYAAACETAKKENKLILLAFSGSDWCGWCMKMEKDIYHEDGEGHLFKKGVHS